MTRRKFLPLAGAAVLGSYVGMKLHGQSLMTDGARALQNVFGEHSAIFAAISEGDGAKAADLMREHLIHSRDRLFGGTLIDLARS